MELTKEIRTMTLTEFLDETVKVASGYYIPERRVSAPLEKPSKQIKHKKTREPGPGPGRNENE